VKRRKNPKSDHRQAAPIDTARQDGRSGPSDRASESLGGSQGTATRALTERTRVLDASEVRLHVADNGTQILSCWWFKYSEKDLLSLKDLKPPGGAIRFGSIG
jgi:hypothetical protein